MIIIENYVKSSVLQGYTTCIFLAIYESIDHLKCWLVKSYQNADPPQVPYRHLHSWIIFDEIASSCLKERKKKIKNKTEYLFCTNIQTLGEIIKCLIMIFIYASLMTN